MTATVSARCSDDLLRPLVPQVVGVLTRRCGDFAAAEDAVQEALLAAAEQWPEQGVPDNPRGWLIQVAWRRLVDLVRAERSRRRREELAARRAPADAWTAPPPDEPEPPSSGSRADAVARDDTLQLLFLCCHPSLSPSAAIALTLRSVGGLTTAEIALAFLVPEATMGQRISRAKQRIRESGIAFAVPGRQEWPQRLAAVLHVLYLVFNEGYASSGGPALQRVELSAEAIRLARALHAAVPEDAEVAGLLALMLLSHARSAARTGPAGELVPLAEQDRARWDVAAVAEGTALITEALARGPVGPYQVQAAIAALHDEAPSAEQTDWPQILALYGVLSRLCPGHPVVALNRAVAVAMVHGPEAGLALLRELEQEPSLARHHRLHAARARLLEAAGDTAGAARCYRAAAERAPSPQEHAYLSLRAARLH